MSSSCLISSILNSLSAIYEEEATSDEARKRNDERLIGGSARTEVSALDIASR